MKERSLWPRLSLAAILSVGFAVIWAMVCAFIYSPVIGGFLPERTHATLMITEDETPVVAQTADGSSAPFEYQDLDGTVLPFEQFQNAKFTSRHVSGGYHFPIFPAHAAERKHEPRASWSG